MPIHFTCPHCGRKTKVGDQYAGHTGPCAGCGQPISVPMPASFATPPVRPRGNSGGNKVLIIVVGVCVAVFLICGGIIGMAVVLPGIQAARETGRRATCTHNLKQIAAAMHQYHDVYKTFPPACLADETGRPMHSWRLLILPYLDQQPLHDKYNRNEPWDGRDNSRLANSMPDVFRCPTNSHDNHTSADYVMVVGPGRISDGTSATRMAMIKDGTSNTIMIVEAPGVAANWLQPVDITDLSQFRSKHPGGAQAALADGSVRFIGSDADRNTLEAMTTIAGGEVVALP